MRMRGRRMKRRWMRGARMRMHGGDNKDKDDGECENRSSQEVNPIKKAVPKAGQRLWREKNSKCDNVL